MIVVITYWISLVLNLFFFRLHLKRRITRGEKIKIEDFIDWVALMFLTALTIIPFLNIFTVAINIFIWISSKLDDNEFDVTNLTKKIFFIK